MKKIYTLLFLSLFVNSLSAQLPYSDYSGKAMLTDETLGNAFLKTAGVGDTLRDHVDRASSFLLQGVTGGGYVFGVSNDGLGASITDATGMHFDSVGHINVEEVFVWIGNKQLVGSPDILKLELYNANPMDSLPTNLVGFGGVNMAFVVAQSAGVNLSNFNGLAKFTITTGNKDVLGSFIVALNYATFDDSLVIVSSNPDSGDGMGQRRAKQLLGLNNGGGWQDAADIWTSGMNADPIIIPVIESAIVGIEEPAFNGSHFRLYNVYPNPSAEFANFKMELLHETETRLIIFDEVGRKLFDSGKSFKQSGIHEYKVNVSALTNGTYYYTLKTNESSLTSRFVVGK